MVGSSAPETIRFQPMAIPTGTPTIIAQRKPLPTRSAENMRLASQVPLYGLRPRPAGPKAQTAQACHTRVRRRQHAAEQRAAFGRRYCQTTTTTTGRTDCQQRSAQANVRPVTIPGADAAWRRRRAFQRASELGRLSRYGRHSVHSLARPRRRQTRAASPPYLAKRLLDERAVPVRVDLARHILLNHAEIGERLCLALDLIRRNDFAKLDHLRGLGGDVRRHAGKLRVGIGEILRATSRGLLRLEISPDETLNRVTLRWYRLFSKSRSCQVPRQQPWMSRIPGSWRKYP